MFHIAQALTPSIWRSNSCEIVYMELLSPGELPPENNLKKAFRENACDIDIQERILNAGKRVAGYLFSNHR